MKLADAKQFRIDITDPDELRNFLTTLFFIIEYFNDRLLQLKIREKACDLSIQFEKSVYELFLEVGKSDVEPAMPFLLKACLDAGIRPVKDERYIDLMRYWLTAGKRALPAPARPVPPPDENPATGEIPGDVKARQRNLDRCKFEVKASLNTEGSYPVSKKFTVVRSEYGESVVSKDYIIVARDDLACILPELVYQFQVEPIDFINTALDLLIKKNKLNEETAKHYLQRWIKNQFGIKYSYEMKLSLKRITDQFNRAFYARGVVSSQKFKTTRPATIEIATLFSILYKVLATDENGGQLFESAQARRMTIGLYLLLRLCKSFRTRYVWLKDNALNRLQQVAGEGAEAAAIVAGLSSRFRRGVACIDAMHPLEYNYFQARSFGSFSCIRGLNYIFRGGLLPYLDEGKATTVIGEAGSGKTTFALQRMVEIAFYGGLSIYISFEESNVIIEDRLNSFRLKNNRHFETMTATIGECRERILAFHRQHKHKGLILLLDLSADGLRLNTTELIDYLGKVAVEADWRYRAMTIDSINSLHFKFFKIIEKLMTKNSKRRNVRELIEAIKHNRFSGIILSEKGDRDFEMLPYLSDVVVSLSMRNNGRVVEVLKARNQNFQFGCHPFRISDGVGMTIYPSLNAVLSDLRHKIRSTISEEKWLMFSPGVGEALGFRGLLEKSTVLMYGSAKNAKARLLYELVLCGNEVSGKQGAAPQSILIVTFRSSEQRYEKLLKSHQDLKRKFENIPRKILHNFTPGSDITAEQIIHTIWEHIRSARREGYPVERVVIDEIESSGHVAPNIEHEKLFWPTLFELLSTEAITSFFIVDKDRFDNENFSLLHDSMDYIFKFSRVIDYDKKEKSVELSIDRWIDNNLHKRGPMDKLFKIHSDFDTDALTIASC